MTHSYETDRYGSPRKTQTTSNKFSVTAYNSVRRFSDKKRECLTSFILQHLVTIVAARKFCISEQIKSFPVLTSFAEGIGDVLMLQAESY